MTSSTMRGGNSVQGMHQAMRRPFTTATITLSVAAARRVVHNGAGMDEELLELAAAPTTRGLVETLSERLSSADPPALSAEALARGELRAALNLALAGALRGAPPPADLAAGLVHAIEHTELVYALLGTVTDGLADALIESSASALHTPSRQGLILFLAASHLEGRDPPDELLRRIRFTARHDLEGQARMLVGLAALETGDPDVLEVARSCVVAADCPAGRMFRRQTLRRFEAPLLEALPKEPPSEIFGAFTFRRDAPRPGRNDPCPCGSGKKYKRCCLPREADQSPAADKTRPWGGRARFHGSMTDAQFEGLHPLEIARVRPADLATPRLLFAIGKLGGHRLFEEAMHFLADLETRRDLPEGTTPESLRAEILMNALAAGDRGRAEEILATFESPDAVPDHARLALAIFRRSPDALERIETMADRALREPSKEVRDLLCSVLIHFSPALGILLARGTIDPAEPLEVESDLGLVEVARDTLLLPPHDPAWEIFDLLSERYVAARLAVLKNEKLNAEAEELRRSGAKARVREQSAQRTLRLREREFESARRSAEKQRAEAERAGRSPGPLPEVLKRLRSKIEEQHVRIAEGNHERRELRRCNSRMAARIAAAAREEEAMPDPDEDRDDLEVEEDCTPERTAPRIPIFSREFREGLRSVADHVARAALATAGALAATDPGAWSSVKNVRALEDFLSCRIGRHRALFRLLDDDEIEFCRLVHRRDLESTLKKMG